MTIQIEQHFRYSGHRQAIYDIRLNQDRKGFFSCGADGCIVSWKWGEVDGELIAQNPGPIYTMCLLQDGRLVAGTSGGVLLIQDIQTRSLIRSIQAHTSGIFSIIEQGDTIITGGGDGYLKRWDKERFDCLQAVPVFSKSVRSIAPAPDGSLLVGGSDCEVVRIHPVTGAKEACITRHLSSVFTLAVSPDKQLLVSAGRDVFLRGFDMSDAYKQVCDIPAHTLHINSLKFNENGRWLISGSMDKTIKIWDPSVMELRKVVDFTRNKGHLSSVNALCWYDAHRFLSASDDKMILGWNIQEEE